MEDCWDEYTVDLHVVGQLSFDIMHHAEQLNAEHMRHWCHAHLHVVPSINVLRHGVVMDESNWSVRMCQQGQHFWGHDSIESDITESGVKSQEADAHCSHFCAGRAGAATGTPPGTATPVQKVTTAVGMLKRATPLSGSLKGLLASGPQFRVSGLRRAGGIKLHNVGSNQKP